MAQQMLVFVHGIGDHPAHWSEAPDGPQAKMNEVAKRYPEITGGQFTDQLIVKEITYDFCFSDLVTQWDGQSTALGQWASNNSRDVPGLIGWLNKTLPSSDSAAKDFFWSTAVDCLLYRGFSLVRDRVRETVMSELVTLLTDVGPQSVNLTIVAHSLGTAVMHDTLHMLGTGQTPPSVGDASMLLPDKFTIDSLFMIADVCLLGPQRMRDIEPFGSICRPINGTQKGDCQKFFEVWHRFDPFAVLAPFRPSDWGPGYTPIGPLSHFRQANVHDFTHYLDHPAVHIPLINNALGGRVISRSTEAAARAAYADILAPQCVQQIQSVKDKAKEFDAVNEDLEALVIKIAEFFAVGKKAKEECPALAGVA